MSHFKTHGMSLTRALLPLLVATTLAGCAAQQLNRQAQRQIKDGYSEKGLENLHKASLLEPDNLRYRLDYTDHLNAETKSLNQRGEALRLAGDFNAAHYAFLTALNFDPSNERSRRGIADVERDMRHKDTLDDVDKLAASGKLDAAKERINVVLMSDHANKRANDALRRIDQQLDAQHRSKEALIVSQSILKKPVTLQFRDANLRMVFEALSRTTGLNVIFDRDVRADLKTTIFVRDGSIEDTVDLILLQNQLEKKILNANTMFIYPAIAAKQKEYQELKVRTFRISNGDAKYIQGMLKSVLKIKEVQVDEHTNTLVLRDTPEALSVAARVIAAHDLPDAEVMLEVEVLEISRDRLSNLGVVWPDNFNVSTPNDINGGPLTLGALKRLSTNSLITTPLQAGLNLKLQDIDANLLASPRIRVREHEKAKILIGDKVPIITNTVTPVSTGTPVITGSVQYIDVGIKLEAEPHVYAEGDVGIKLNLEVSNIVKEIAGPGGSLAYQIGTRMVSTSLRLHDGETQVLGGLISDSDRNTAAKVPGIGQLPILGRLFSNNNGDHTKTEIVLSITPRILRAKGVAEDTMADVWSGTEGSIRENPLRLDPISSVSGTQNTVTGIAATRTEPLSIPLPVPSPSSSSALVPAKPISSPAIPVGLEVIPTPPAPLTPTGPVSLTPTVAPPLVPPVASSLESASSSSVLSSTGSPSMAAMVPVSTGTNPKISLSSPDNVKTGDRFNVTLSGENFDKIHALPLSIQYDAVVLTFIEATLGEFSTRSHAGNVEPVINQPAGRASILLTSDQTGSFVGSGELLNLVFVAKLPRKKTQVLVAKVDINDGHTLISIARPQPVILAVNP